MSSPKTYTGNCHCGAYKFSAEFSEPITSGTACNCSICSKKGYIWGFPSKEIVVERDEGKTIEYGFGKRGLLHKFCGVCGTPILGDKYDKSTGEHKIMLNIRTLNNLDIWSLNVSTFDGKHKIPTTYQPPTFTGPDPSITIPGSKIYHGNCHCGAVTYAFKSLPLTDPSLSIFECNCSICSRNAHLLLSPTPLHTQLSISPTSHLHLTSYHRNKETPTINFQFCKICGITLFLEMIGEKGKEVMPLNLRGLNLEGELEGLEIGKYAGKDVGGDYVVL